MSGRKGFVAWILVLALSVAPAAFGLAGEHPKEHPQEHPKKQEPPTVDSVATYIEEWVASEADEDGWMSVYDEVADADLELTLDKVHRDRLSKTAPTTWFVCADFKSDDGKLYDLDFWVEQTADGLKVSETMVHKVDGKARYNWFEEKGIWVRKPL